MENPHNGERYIIYWTDDNGERQQRFIITTYSANRTGRAWNGFSDTCLATATGYGYDKESAVLSEAIEKVTGREIGASAAGVNAVIDSAAGQGIRVYDWNALQALSYEYEKENY